MAAAYYDFFRKITLQPDGVTLEADSTTDTLTITRGNGVAFTPNATTDSFSIDVDYQHFVPLGTTALRLQDVNATTQDIALTPGPGIDIQRIGANELYLTSYGVGETDTLHTVSTRSPITPNTLVMNGLEVGQVLSSAGIDGFSANSGQLVGTGTQYDPLVLDQQFEETTSASFNIVHTFTTINATGTMYYSFGFEPSNVLTSGSALLEREDTASPGTWNVVSNVAGIGTSLYRDDNSYPENTDGLVNYRLTFNFTGNSSVVKMFAQFIFESFDFAANSVLQTDTTAGTVSLLYAGSEKLVTTNTGVNVTGSVVASSAVSIGTANQLNLYDLADIQYIESFNELYMLSNGNIHLVDGNYKSYIDCDWATKTVSLNYINGTTAEEKLATTATGVDVTGIITADSSTITRPVSTIQAISGTTPTIDPSLGGMITWTLTGASSPVDGLSDGDMVLLEITANGNTISAWPTITWHTDAGAAPILNGAGTTNVILWKISTVLHGVRVGDA